MKVTVLMMIAGIVMLGAARAAEAQALTPGQMESYAVHVNSSRCLS